jgi:hypothetical protein
MVDIWPFHPKKFMNVYTFCSKEMFWMLFGYIQPNKRTMGSLGPPSYIKEKSDKKSCYKNYDIKKEFKRNKLIRHVL